MKTAFEEIQLNGEYSDSYLIYTRKSTDDAENQKNSIEYQVSENLRFAQKENISIAQYSLEGFCENGIIQEKHSGFTEDEFFNVYSDGSISQQIDRPKFLNMADLLVRKEFKGVLCLCWDRISRNETDDVVIKKLLRQGIDIRFAQVKYDKSSSGDLHMDIDGVFSRHYSRVISEKVRNASVKLRKEGRCLYISPIGYLDHGSDNKPFDPERAFTVKRIFELYATGEWSFASLADWAIREGLTTKPARRKRTFLEKLNGTEVDAIPKLPRAITRKTIEHILKNPFYIGKNVYGTNWIDSTAHQPLIDTSLFLKVQSIIKSKTVSIHYPKLLFYTYRGLFVCAQCKRKYSPYEQKNIIYYRSKCKANCTNTHKNVNEDFIDSKISEVLDRIYFTDYELANIQAKADIGLNKVTLRINSQLNDLRQQLNKANADLDYLSQEKITLLRSQAWTIEQIRDEEARIKGIIKEVNEKISANSVSTKFMLNFIISFSDLVKNATLYFQKALDAEKRDIVVQVFSELSFENGNLKYQLKLGFGDLMNRLLSPYWQSGSPDYLFSELPSIFARVKTGMEKLKKLACKMGHYEREYL